MPTFLVLISLISWTIYEYQIRPKPQVVSPEMPRMLVQTREDVTKEIWTQDKHFFIHSDASTLTLSADTVTETLFHVNAELPSGYLQADELIWNQNEQLTLDSLGDVHFSIQFDEDPLFIKQYL